MPSNLNETCLVLDIDETLLHAFFPSNSNLHSPTFAKCIQFDFKFEYNAHVEHPKLYFIPEIEKLFKSVIKYIEMGGNVIFFTAAAYPRDIVGIFSKIAKFLFGLQKNVYYINRYGFQPNVLQQADKDFKFDSNDGFLRKADILKKFFSSSIITNSIKPSNCVFVDDSINHFKLACRLGFITVLADGYATYNVQKLDNIETSHILNPASIFVAKVCQYLQEFIKNCSAQQSISSVKTSKVISYQYLKDDVKPEKIHAVSDSSIGSGSFSYDKKGGCLYAKDIADTLSREGFISFDEWLENIENIEKTILDPTPKPTPSKSSIPLPSKSLKPSYEPPVPPVADKIRVTSGRPPLPKRPNR